MEVLKNMLKKIAGKLGLNIVCDICCSIFWQKQFIP